jgi:hypothetical protein
MKLKGAKHARIEDYLLSGVYLRFVTGTLTGVVLL